MVQNFRAVHPVVDCDRQSFIAIVVKSSLQVWLYNYIDYWEAFPQTFLALNVLVNLFAFNNYR